MSVQILVDAINQWGLDRNITAEGGATVMAQMSKMTEEFAEFLGTWNTIYIMSQESGCSIGELLEQVECERELKIKAQLEDDFGDMLVCLIQAMRLANTDMETCLAKAWNDIKDRKGRMVNGKFVKES